MQRFASALRFGFAITAIVTLFGGPAWTAEDTAATKPATPEYNRVRSLGDDVTLATLSNGLTVIVQENHVAPVATVRCYVKNTGSAFEGRYLGAGLSHVLEHVVAGGTTTHRSEKEIEQIIDTFGGATNAYTSHDMTAFYIDCPAKNVKTAIELVADSMQHVVFEPKEFERELSVVRRELADGEVDRGRVLQKLLGETVYHIHPIRYPIIGYLEVLNGTSNQAIIDFYRSRYVPNNQVFVVVGDVATDDVLQQVAQQWTGTPRGRETAVAMPQEPGQMMARKAFRQMDGATYDFALAWPTVELSHPDLYALDLAAYILSEGDSSRLERKLKYDKSLVLSISSASYTPYYVRGWFGVFASATPDNWAKAVVEIQNEVYRLKNELVAGNELAKAKKQKAAELVFGRQTVQQAAEDLGHNFLSTGDPMYSRIYVENIQKVTAEQIRDVARRYFTPDRLSSIVIAPPGAAAAASEEAASKKEGETRLVRLDNGLRVLVKRHSHLPMVNVQAYVLGGGLVDSQETAGRSAIVAAMLDKGTPTRSAQQIADYFDSIGGSISTSAGRSTVYGSMTCLRDDFDEAAPLFAECFVHPTFPDQELGKVRTLALGAIARRSADPRQEAFNVLYKNLPKSTPYSVNPGGQVDTVKSLTVDELKAFHEKYFVPENMVVAVFGDVEPDRAVAFAKKAFGQLKPAPAAKPINFDRDNAIPKTTVVHKQTAKQTGMVLMAYPGPSVLDNHDYSAMVVLDALTSGYSYPGGWLHNELRGEGLVYYVHAMQMTGPAPGYLLVIAQTQPDKIDKVVSQIVKAFDRAKAGKIEPEEFERAKQMVVALHAQQDTTISGQAQQAALDELYGQGFNHDKTFADRINAITLDDVIAVAKKYLNDYLLVTTSPIPAGK